MDSRGDGLALIHSGTRGGNERPAPSGSIAVQWPQWAYFLNQVDDSLKLLLSCVAGRTFLGVGAVEIDAELVASVLSRASNGMNMVCDRFGFPDAELEKMSRCSIGARGSPGPSCRAAGSIPTAPR